ncbi:hypothetical protein EDL98_11500 [Ornithobacterium rhinotracheale]|nr:hypothetical protein [Ornithobacterium rhinotracheale]
MCQIVQILEQQQAINDKIPRQVPVIAQKSVQEQPKKPKRKGFLGIFGKKEEAKPTVTPQAVYGLQTVEDVFNEFSPSVELEHQDAQGNEIKETMKFKNLGDFESKKIKENSDFLSKLDIEKEQSKKIARQLSSNRALLKALENTDTKEAIIKILESSLEEINTVE